MAAEVRIKDSQGREVYVKCDQETSEKCREEAEKAYEKLRERDKTSARPSQ